MSKSNSEFLIVANQLFERYRRPMTAKELVHLGRDEGLFSDKLSGKTPHQTMKSKLSVHIRRKGAGSTFVRTRPGLFYLRHLVDSNTPLYEAPPLKPPTPAEAVLVFPTEELDKLLNFQGVSTSWRRVTESIFGRLLRAYRPRIDVEQDNGYTQILTYILVTRKHEVLAYKRGTYNQLDAFLRGSHCVGFGGHVTQDDLTLFNVKTLGVLDSAGRELSEELELPDEDVRRLQTGEGLNFIGVINDDSSAVGRRHTAFVLKYEVSQNSFWDRPRRGERSITQLRWLSPQTSQIPSLWMFEYWSQLCLREYFPDLVRAHTAYRLRHKAPLVPPHVLCVLGPVGSGKSEATNNLIHGYGYREINSGRIMAQLLGVPPIPETPREVFQEMSWKYIKRRGGTYRLACAIWDEVRSLDVPRILIDGIRQKNTLSELRKLATDRRIGVIFVHTSPDVAYRFYKSRFRGDFDVKEFLKIRSADVEAEVESMIADADAVLYNWTGKVEYRRAIQSMMSDLRITF